MVGPRIIYSGFYKGGRDARSDLKTEWNYGHLMFDLAVADPGWRVNVTQIMNIRIFIINVFSQI